MRIAVVANSSWNLHNFRRGLMKALLADGHEVLAVGPDDGYAGKLTEQEFQVRTIPLQGASINPLREIQTVLALRQVLQEEAIDVVASYTPKGNIYSALASQGGMALIPNVSGLGRVFIKPSALTLLVKALYRVAFSRAYRVVFQSQEDLELFVKLGLVTKHKTQRIAGSGVNLETFALAQTSGTTGTFVFLLIARMLWDKGVGEFVEAARRVRAQHPNAEFQLLGALDVQNPSAIAREQVQAWEAEGVIRYMGVSDDVAAHIGVSDCVVLPSYREGLPRTMLEGAAMGKPLITTDAPGCRDTVDDGVTGFLCKPRDASDLAEKMLQMLALTSKERSQMGLRGRQKMELEFDEQLVIKRYLELISEIEKQR